MGKLLGGNQLPSVINNELTGGAYLKFGMILMGVKLVADSLFASLIFHHQWSFLEYFLPGVINDFSRMTPADLHFYLLMLCLSLPFAYFGCVLTVRRLRTLNLPPQLVLLFYVPFVNMIFFVVLCLARPRITDSSKDIAQTQVAEASTSSSQSYKHLAVRLMDRIPDRGVAGLLAASLLPVPLSVVAAIFSVSIFGTYGWGVFVAIPFAASIAAAIIHSWRKPRSYVQCLQAALICLFGMASLLLLIPFEGIICLMMASPLAIGIALVGGSIGYLVQSSFPRDEQMPKLLGCFALLVPLMIGAEFAAPPPIPLYTNVSSVEINAPPNVVWKYLIDFPEMQPPTEWLFKTGIAYPIKAKIYGHGPGAIRHCIFSTGKFVEPIQVWDEPRLLKFGVLAQAPPMHELSFYPNLHPPHLDNYLVSRNGQFLLTLLPDGRTRLDGTTWYQNYMGPSPYWRFWADWIIHRIHMRVLDHVKTLAEADNNRLPRVSFRCPQ